MNHRPAFTPVLLVAAILAASRTVFAQPAPGDLKPTVRESFVGGRFIVDGTFDATVSDATVWAVLTDYERIGRFVPNVRVSKVLRNTADGAVVRQVMVAHVLFLSRETHLVLELHEVPMSAIRFSDIGQEDFELYLGSWRVTQADGRERVAYHLEAKPRFGVPSFVGNSVFTSAVADLLEDVRREMIRRSMAQVLSVRSQSNFQEKSHATP